MRSIERRFQKEYKVPGTSTYIALVRAIKGQGFSRSVIARWFNQLVDKADYSRSDKEDILQNLYSL